MEILFYNNNSEVNKINKTLTQVASFTGALRNESNIVDPNIILQNAGKPQGNYFYIADFGRYYFIKEIKSIRNDLWEITGHCDVLKSFATSILNLKVTLSDTQTTGKNNYINNSAYVTTQKSKTNIMRFPNGLLNDGQYVLITAGGSGGI